jgi:hypothetical protein
MKSASTRLLPTIPIGVPAYRTLKEAFAAVDLRDLRTNLGSLPDTVLEEIREDRDPRRPDPYR